MRYAALLVGFYATTACSLDHVVVAELDSAGAGGSPLVVAGGPSAAGAGGAAGAAPSAGSGGSLFSGGSPALGDGGGATFAAGGVVDTLIIGDGGGGSEMRCSCMGQTSELCGTDGITYPSQCVDAGICSPPGIACAQACPCPDGGIGNLPTTPSEWFPQGCASSAHCSEGVICLAFSGATFNDQPTPCN
ncbi:MAG TPA: hypothetical protein VHM25_21370 [Polyangiaceae bacterium]|jgi:hypothetical protein|nr:hypothetical protein [Polyangiaceae bacterium]